MIITISIVMISIVMIWMFQNSYIHL